MHAKKILIMTQEEIGNQAIVLELEKEKMVIMMS